MDGLKAFKINKTVQAGKILDVDRARSLITVEGEKGELKFEMNPARFHPDSPNVGDYVVVYPGKEEYIDFLPADTAEALATADGK